MATSSVSALPLSHAERRKNLWKTSSGSIWLIRYADSIGEPEVLDSHASFIANGLFHHHRGGRWIRERAGRR